jgi:putative tricarboxylic transport membrane protein
MTDVTNEPEGTGPSQRNVEIGVAVAIALIAVIGIIGALRVGTGWSSEGPRAGFFPFYICIAILISCAVNLVQIFKSENDGGLFASWSQINKVLQVVIPTAVYVFVIPYSGIYVASALLIFGFMLILGKYSVAVSLAVGIGVTLFTFVAFERWFMVPLPKGPLENMLGY